MGDGILRKIRRKGGPVVIPKSRIKSGIKSLDPLVQGGLRPFSTTLVVGSAGSGKTILAMQFLMEGLKNGESCIYITFEERKERLYSDMDIFGWDFRKYEEKKKFFMLEYTPEQVKSLIEEGGGAIDRIITKNKITRLVIDSITSFLLLYQDELARKEAGLALFELMKTWECTSLLTSQALFEGNEMRGVILDFEADGVVYLYHVKLNGIRHRAIEILKMRGTRHSDKTLKMEITSSGVVISPSKVVTLR